MRLEPPAAGGAGGGVEFGGAGAGAGGGVEFGGAGAGAGAGAGGALAGVSAVGGGAPGAAGVVGVAGVAGAAGVVEDFPNPKRLDTEFSKLFVPPDISVLAQYFFTQNQIIFSPLYIHFLSMYIVPRPGSYI
jgi:hypothetical protein